MAEVYAITDLEGYASQMRDAAAQSLTDTGDCTDNLDDFISIDQMIKMVKDECLGFDDEDRPLLDEETNEKIFEDTSVWIHNVGLAKLAAQDLVECAWDNESNEMVFWAKTKSKPNAKRKSKSGRKNKKSEG